MGRTLLPANPPPLQRNNSSNNNNDTAGGKKNGRLNTPCLQEGISWITSFLIQWCLKSDSTDIEDGFYGGDTAQMHGVSTKSLFAEGRTEHFM